MGLFEATCSHAAKTLLAQKLQAVHLLNFLGQFESRKKRVVYLSRTILMEVLFGTSEWYLWRGEFEYLQEMIPLNNSTTLRIFLLFLLQYFTDTAMKREFGILHHASCMDSCMDWHLRSKQMQVVERALFSSNLSTCSYRMRRRSSPEWGETVVAQICKYSIHALRKCIGIWSFCVATVHGSNIWSTNHNQPSWYGKCPWPKIDLWIDQLFFFDHANW